jgi:hypothetical protein
MQQQHMESLSLCLPIPSCVTINLISLQEQLMYSLPGSGPSLVFLARGVLLPMHEVLTRE